MFICTQSHHTIGEERIALPQRQLEDMAHEWCAYVFEQMPQVSQQLSLAAYRGFQDIATAQAMRRMLERYDKVKQKKAQGGLESGWGCFLPNMREDS